jgi:hypothetical protein
VKRGGEKNNPGNTTPPTMTSYIVQSFKDHSEMCLKTIHPREERRKHLSEAPVLFLDKS